MKHQNWRKAFKLILKRSVVPGVPEVVATRDSSRRCLKLCVFVLCSFGFFYYTSAFLVKYWEYPTVMDVVVEYPEMVEVPAVTICNYNGISATLFCTNYSEFCSPQRNYSEFCSQFFYLCDKNYEYEDNISIPAISPYELPTLERINFKGLGNKPEDLIEACYIITSSSGAFPCRNETKWIRVFDTQGLPNNCYAINSNIGDVSRKPDYIRSKSAIILKIKKALPDTFYSSTPSAMQIAIHSPRTIVNPFKKGVLIKPCYNYHIFLSKTVNQLLPYPYATNCTDYVKLWESRGGNGPLSQTQCREECLLNVSLADASCVDPFFVDYPNKAKMCDHSANRLYFKRCANVCSRACHRENIKVDVEEHALMLEESDEDEDYECFSVITLAFNRMELKTFSYYPKYQNIEIFGYVGGYLGVWLGISLIAISDVLETFCVIIKVIRTKILERKQKKLERMNKKYYSYYADSRGNFRMKIY